MHRCRGRAMEGSWQPLKTHLQDKPSHASFPTSFLVCSKYWLTQNFAKESCAALDFTAPVGLKEFHSI